MKFPVLAICAYVGMSFEINQEIVNELIIQPENCLLKNCPTQLSAAKNDDAFNICKAKCVNDKQCWPSCLTKLQGSDAYNVAKCGQKNYCFDIPEHELQLMLGSTSNCVEKNCAYEWKNYKKDLATVQACSNSCKKNQACWQKCIKTDSTKTAIQVTLCAQKHNCIPPIVEDSIKDEQCFKTHCPDEYKTITTEPDLPDFKKCYNKCGAKKQCWTFCLPSKVRKTLADAAECATRNKCQVLP